jgi:hypothetical protein
MHCLFPAIAAEAAAHVVAALLLNLVPNPAPLRRQVLEVNADSNS